jgi:hypothetical protein
LELPGQLPQPPDGQAGFDFGIGFLGIGTFSNFAPPPRMSVLGIRFTPLPGIGLGAQSIRTVSVLPHAGQVSPEVQSEEAISSNTSLHFWHSKS